MHLYTVLALPRACSLTDIKREFLRAAVKWHPERFSGSPPPQAVQHFTSLAHAYQVLSNPQTRKKYDAIVAEGGGDSASLSAFSEPPSLQEALQVLKQCQAADLMARDQEAAMLTQKAKQAGVGKVSLDLCFIIDATESMGPYIHAAKESVQNVVDEFAHRYGADAAMRFAVLGFRDIEDARPREVLDFTPSQQQLHSFLAALSACTQHQPRPPTGTNTDGWPLEPDWPEDLTGALNDACHLSWSSPTRVAIVITDAPCHGREFYDLSEWGFANEEEANATRRRGRRRRGNSAKDVAFLIDYSGSMAGAKIASARTALRRIFEQHMSEDDYFSLSRFSSTVHRMLPRTRKGEDGGACCTAIGGLVSPDGQTAMNDAICNQLQFVLPASERAQWVVVLTDGEDNRSAASYDETRRRLEACDSLAGLIIVGCGSAPERSLS